jgi:hypothetical protein
MDKEIYSLAFEAAEAALEIDKYLQRNRFNREKVVRIKDVLEDKLNSPNFPFTWINFLHRTFQENSNKQMQYVEELRLETRLFVSELRDMETLPKERVENLRRTMCSLYRNAIAEHSFFERRYIA